MTTHITTFDKAHAESSGIVYQTGVLNQTINNCKDASPLGLEERFSNVTLQNVAHYVQRPDLHQSLKAQLHDVLEADTSSSTVVVIHGIGGAGKTQLALHYVRQFRNDYNGTFWIHAGSRVTAEREIGLIYRLIHSIPPSAAIENLDLHELLIRINTWFMQRPGRWLWVLDSADNVDDPADDGYIDLAALSPSAPSVQVLVTSRSGNARKVTRSKPIEVSSLAIGEALSLFWQTSEIEEASVTDSNRKIANSMMEDLDCLALGVQLAGITVQKSPRMAEDLNLYLLEYRRNRQELIARQPDWLVTRYDRSLLTAWETTFAHIVRRSATAANLLGFLALLDETDIFIGLFEMALTPSLDGLEEIDRGEPDAPDGNKWKWQDTLVGASEVNLRLFESSLDVLRSFSFVHYKSSKKRYSMHKLVQEWGYHRLEGHGRTVICRAAVDFITRVLSRCGTEPTGKSRLLKHIRKSFQVSSAAALALPDQDCLAFIERFRRYRDFTDGTGSLTESEMVERFEWERLSCIFRDEHPDTISAMSNLANTLGDQGKLDDAAAMKKEVLEKMAGPWRRASKHHLGDEQPGQHARQPGQGRRRGRDGEGGAGEEEADPRRRASRHHFGDEQPGRHAQRAGRARRGGRYEEGGAGEEEADPRRRASRHHLGDEQPGQHARRPGRARRGGRDDGRRRDAKRRCSRGPTSDDCSKTPELSPPAALLPVVPAEADMVSVANGEEICSER